VWCRFARRAGGRRDARRSGGRARHDAAPRRVTVHGRRVATPSTRGEIPIESGQRAALVLEVAVGVRASCCWPTRQRRKRRFPVTPSGAAQGRTSRLGLVERRRSWRAGGARATSRVDLQPFGHPRPRPALRGGGAVVRRTISRARCGSRSTTNACGRSTAPRPRRGGRGGAAQGTPRGHRARARWIASGASARSAGEGADAGFDFSGGAADPIGRRRGRGLGDAWLTAGVLARPEQTSWRSRAGTTSAGTSIEFLPWVH
jgi:hypothetical protein